MRMIFSKSFTFLLLIIFFKGAIPLVWGGSEIHQIDPVCMIVLGTRLRIRSEPKVTSTVLSHLTKGERVVSIESTDYEETIDGLNGPWVKVINSNGDIGWVFGGYLKKIEIEMRINKEEDRILTAPHPVKRQGSRLYLPLANHTEIILEDAPSVKEGGGGMYYEFERFLHRTNQYLIHWSNHWETDGYACYDWENGTQILLENEPIFSPEKKRYFVVGYNLTEDDFIRFSIAQIESGKPSFVFIYNRLRYMPLGAYWLNENTVVVIGSKYYPAGRVGLIFYHAEDKWNQKQIDL